MFPTHDEGLQARVQSSRFLSDLRGSWATICSLVAAQCLGSLCASLSSGPLPYEATNTDLLYSHSVTLFLFIFVTFQTNSVFGLCLAIYNAVLLTAFLGWPQVSNVKLTQRKFSVHVFSLLGVVCMRMLIGYLFGRGTGFAYPLLFFNDAIHETTCGLSVIILYYITRRAYQDSAGESSGHAKFLPIALILWSPNAIRGPVFFWSFSTSSITGIQSLLVLLFERRETALGHSYRRSAPRTSRFARFVVMLRTFLLLGGVFTAISFLHSLAYRHKHNIHARMARDLPEPVLTHFLILSYPRRNNSTLLSSTLQSYVPGLGSRFQANVYTTVAPGTHSAFMNAQKTFRGSSGLSFFEDPTPAPLHLSKPIVPGYLPGKQTLDLYSALSWAEQNIHSNTSRYLGIMEDDFAWCKAGWEELKAIVYQVSLRDVSQASKDRFCGIFVATGGSGLLVRPSVIPLLRNALRTYAFDFNTDIILQDCLRGELPICSECKLAASRRLLFRHTGASQSTYLGRMYPEDRWQCGWRQPFNGKPGVWVP